MKFYNLLGPSVLAFTPKAFQLVAQGCGASPLPWAEDDATLSGLVRDTAFPQGSREARQPWAVISNPFRVQAP